MLIEKVALTWKFFMQAGYFAADLFLCPTTSALLQRYTRTEHEEDISELKVFWKNKKLLCGPVKNLSIELNQLIEKTQRLFIIRFLPTGRQVCFLLIDCKRKNPPAFKTKATKAIEPPTPICPKKTITKSKTRIGKTSINIYYATLTCTNASIG